MQSQRFKTQSDLALAAHLLYTNGTIAEAEAETLARGGALAVKSDKYEPMFLFLDTVEKTAFTKFCWKDNGLDPGIASLGKDAVTYIEVKPPYGTWQLTDVFGRPHFIVCLQRQPGDKERARDKPEAKPIELKTEARATTELSMPAEVAPPAEAPPETTEKRRPGRPKKADAVVITKVTGTEAVESPLTPKPGGPQNPVEKPLADAADAAPF